MTTAFDEAACLKFDIFADVIDGENPLRDKVVTFRKEGVCHTCGETIAPGTRGRSLIVREYDELLSCRFCATCSAAMAKAELTGDDDEIEARIAARRALP